MSFLRDADAAQLREHFAKNLQGPVEIDFFTQSAPELVVPGKTVCVACPDTARLLEEVAQLSDKIRLRVHDLERDKEHADRFGLERIPAFVLGGAARGRVRYLGIPSGYEFVTLLGDLVDVSSGTTDLAPQTRQRLAGLQKDVHIQVFVTPSCPYCPGVARMAHKMAVENARITADVVEISEFPDLADRYGVRGVPMIVVNDEIELVGAQREAAMLDAVLRAAA